MVRFHNLHFVFIFIISILALSPRQARGDQTTSDFLQTLGPLQKDIYTEMYSSPLTQVSNQFQRLRLISVTYQPWNPFLGFERFSSQGISDVAAEVGVRNVFGDLQFLLSLRREKMNESNLTFWNLRAGLIYSQFWQLDGALFADAYSEFFANQQESQKAGASISGWGKLGYRYHQKDHLFFDPVIVGARLYDNSDRKIYGSDYQLLQIGMQGGVYLEKPEISSTVILSKSWGRSQSAQVVNDYWLLWALGVRF